MANYGGYRSHRTITGTSGELTKNGEFLFAEVSSDVDTNFYPNVLDHEGNPVPYKVDPIPIKSTETRRVPLAIYNFRSDNPVTVVAYRM